MASRQGTHRVRSARSLGRLALSFAIEDKGILPDRMIASACRRRRICPPPISSPTRFSPQSLDLRLGEVAYRVRASFLPAAPVAQRIDELKLHELRSPTARCWKPLVYIVPLLESLALPDDISAPPIQPPGRL
jgi:dCTP deaminase